MGDIIYDNRDLLKKTKYDNGAPLHRKFLNFIRNQKNKHLDETDMESVETYVADVNGLITDEKCFNLKGLKFCIGKQELENWKNAGETQRADFDRLMALTPLKIEGELLTQRLPPLENPGDITLSVRSEDTNLIALFTPNSDKIIEYDGLLNKYILFSLPTTLTPELSHFALRMIPIVVQNNEDGSGLEVTFSAIKYAAWYSVIFYKTAIESENTAVLNLEKATRHHMQNLPDIVQKGVKVSIGDVERRLKTLHNEHKDMSDDISSVKLMVEDIYEMLNKSSRNTQSP